MNPDTLLTILTALNATNSSSFSPLEVLPDIVVLEFSESIITILDRNYVSSHSATMITRRAKVSPETDQLQLDILNNVMLETSHEIAFIFSTTDDIPRRPYFYNVFFIDGYEAFRSVLKEMTPARYDYSGHYLIVLTAPEIIDEITLHDMFAELWSLNIVNVVVVTTTLDQSEGIADVLLYTYYPYVENQCERDNPVLLYRWLADTLFDPHVELFPNKLLDFHGCPIRIASFYYPPYTMIKRDPKTGTKTLEGVEGDLLHLIADKFNFTVELVEVEEKVKWGVIKNKKAISGALKLTADGKVNISIGAFAMRGERMTLLKQSDSYYTMKMLFAVPPGRPYSAFEKLFRPFSILTWIILSTYLLLGFVVVFLLKFCSKSMREFVYGRRVRMPWLNMINLFFGGAIIRTPGRNFARTLIFLWLYYCFVMRSLYQGSLFEYLQQQKNFSHVNTLWEIEHENMPYWLSYAGKMYLEGMPHILERSETIPETTTFFFDAHRKQGTNELNVAILTTFDQVAYYNEHFYTRGIVFPTDEVLLRQPICLYYPKISCLTELFDGQIGNIKTAGLIRHWMHQYVGYRFFRREKHQHIPAVLTNEHMIGCYQSLWYLLIFATLVFILEMLSMRCSRLARAFDFLML
ncbi:uncharacterized protein LOC129757949 [Uranotaenia lowii]|uniref:uncharacterized protein LOC129757949 n=1 Tax=Uranotaenia lowii TaxID=190385 RepID=UPI002479AD3A|nr:uncharacterized protein LOC129757949 [Uranotaenia lowii]